MKKVSRQLMVFYTAQVLMALVFIVLFETDVLPTGVKADDKQSEFVLTATACPSPWSGTSCMV